MERRRGGGRRERGEAYGDKKGEGEGGDEKGGSGSG